MFNLGVTFETIECFKCHCQFAVTRETMQQLLRTHEGFYCPFGHLQYFLSKSTEDKLRDEVAQAVKDKEYWRERSNEWRERNERQERKTIAMRGVVTKIKKSIVRGNCPRCGKHFHNMAEHMKAHAKVKNVRLRFSKRNNKRNVTANA